MYNRERERERERAGGAGGAAASSFIQTWTVWDPRERFNMDTRFRMKCYDVTLNFLVFTPLVILHHQSGNGILDFLFLRQFPTLGAWILLVFGVGIEFLLCFFHKFLLRRIPKDQEIYPIIASHAFIYLLTFANIAHVRAVGDLYGIYIGEDWRSAVKAMTTGLAALVGLKACKNLLAPPLTLTIDSHQHEEVFETQTLFGTEGDLSPGSALDSFATVGIVHSFIHLYWSGWWSFLDVWLFPGSPALSSIVCIIAGYVGCTLAILIHGIAKQTSRNLQSDENDLVRLVFEDLYHVFAGTAAITTWRGFWNWFYVMGDNFPILYKGKDVTSVVAHAISFALLALANVSMSLCGKGVDIDGAMVDGQGVTCCTDYFCDYFKDEIEEEEETKRKQDVAKGVKPVAMVTGNQQKLNGSPATVARQRSVKKKVDDDVAMQKQQQQQQQQQPQRHRTEARIEVAAASSNNNNAQVKRKKKEL